jgi:hypothetical protein
MRVWWVPPSNPGAGVKVVMQLLFGCATQKLPASLLAYGAKLWSACSLLPLLPAPACWRLVYSTSVPPVNGLGRDGPGTRAGSKLPPEKAAASCTHSKASLRTLSLSPSRLGRSIALRLIRKDEFENPSKTLIPTFMSRTLAFHANCKSCSGPVKSRFGHAS